MGAVTSLFYTHRHSYNVECLVVDSPFLHLEKSVINLAKNKMWIPPFLTSMMLKLINSKIIEKIGFNVLDLNVELAVREIETPSLIIASKHDDLVEFEDFVHIYKNFGHKKAKMLLTEKAHNEFRESGVIAESLTFILSYIVEDFKIVKEEVLWIFEKETLNNQMKSGS